MARVSAKPGCAATELPLKFFRSTFFAEAGGRVSVYWTRPFSSIQRYCWACAVAVAAAMTINASGERRTPGLWHALPQLRPVDASCDLLQPGLERRVDLFDLQPDLRHLRLARSDARAANAPRAQRREPRLRRFLAAEHAERDGPSGRALVLHDEIVLHAELFQLAGLARRGLARAA